MVKAGALPAQMLRKYYEAGHIFADEAIEEGAIQPTSFDLRISEEGYELEGSTLPVPHRTPLTQMLVDTTFTKRTIDLSKPTTLYPRKTYLVRLMEGLRLPPNVSGMANPKSSTGRIDVQVRLLTEKDSRFDTVSKGYNGQLYLEISPKTMPVIVQKGDKFNQLRLFTNTQSLSAKELEHLYDTEHLFYDDSGKQIKRTEDLISEEGLQMSVNLLADSPDRIVGWKLKKDAPPLDLSRRDCDPHEFFEPVYEPENGKLKVEQDAFYILRTIERIRVPLEQSCEMLPYDARVGNLRTHYAGFFDPGFGYGSAGEILGTFAVLEVRPHDENIILMHGQPICVMKFWNNVDIPDVVYGTDIKSNYQGQRLKLAKFFVDK